MTRKPRGADVAALTPRALARLARPPALALLRRLTAGRLTLVDGASRFEFGRDASPYAGGRPLAATATVHDPRVYSSLMAGGLLGAGEAYARGDFTCDDLVAVARMFAADRELLAAADHPLTRIALPWHRLRYLLRWSSRAGSRRNIADHYDVGNDFFALFLDETMTYSSGIFESPGSSLADASIAKYERVCRKLRLAPGERVIEIGGGWGGFAVHAATRYGCHVTTTTISENQFAYAKRRVAAAGLAGRVEVLLRDYRDLDGRYDKLASIEMIEAVGDGYLDAYFATCSRLLSPQGLMLVQSILAPDQGYERYRSSIGFTQRYIFPGGILPCLTAIAGAMSRATDLRIVHLEDISPHYAPTLRTWRERLLAAADRARALGYDDGFLRTWEFYFATCEAGFLEGGIGNAQVLFAKPGCTDAVYDGAARRSPPGVETPGYTHARG